ncbi:SDR family NAD(P)-dependent oxidoreductase [Frigidibacter sp. ROC022]|uniref:SDR family NAD(P)-dependent oxidoreductase n=1 Tax=Frigidibacter sp. ROC022 TaxID=2971796 RepID=UPI00215B33A7|nr:SDR family oxidoreductase [Frigidibacter sp. ROC022]MCR8722952.1 SDR family oxidoreductase [Frigidibacter sp. ROC022]
MPAIALVIGASRGIGRSIAVNLGRAGVDVILTYLGNAAAAEEVVSEIEAAGRRAAALQLDTGAAGDLPAFVARVDAVLGNWGSGRIDYLVNNAGVGLIRPFAETSAADLDRMTEVLWKGPYRLTQQLAPRLADGGRILMITSRTARKTKPGMSVYGPLKAAVEALVPYLAAELGPRRITVNAVAPGAVATDFNGGRLRDDSTANARTAATTALGRVAEAGDIGGAVADLLTGRFHWMTGERIELSGGQGL